MTKYIARRLLVSIPVVIGITILTFLFSVMAPGDPVTMLINPEVAAAMGPDWVAARRAELGLDQPLPIRYAAWLGEVVRGNLGYSLVNRQPVAERIRERVWPTVELMGTALLIGILVGAPLGVISAVKQYSLLDYVFTVLGMTAISTPSFFLGLFFIYVFALWLNVLPTSGLATVGAPPTVIDSLRHLILPASVLGLAQAAPLLRYTRSAMLEVIHQEYVTTARAKGLAEHVILERHALRNALIPVVTVVALTLPTLFGGAVITEQVFQWPGMGMLAIAAINGRDYPVILGLNLFFAFLVLFANLLTDVTYAWIDPRIHYN